MDLDRIAVAVAALPTKYEPLCLSFTREFRSTDDGAVVVGSDEGTEIRVDLVSGRVTSADPQTARTTRLVNSSIDQLVASIAAYDEYAGRVRDVDDEDAKHLVRELRQRLSTIDPAVTADAESWWSLIVEQAHDGLL